MYNQQNAGKNYRLQMTRKCVKTKTWNQKN